MKFPNYNILANIPITNLVGTTTDPIDLDSLVTIGTYKISGDVTSADWSLVTEVDAIIASWDVFLSVLDFGTPAQVYSLLAPSQYVFRVYSWGWGAITIINYIQDDWTWIVLWTPASWNLDNCTADWTDKVGFRNIPANSQSTAYTAVLADSWKSIDHPSTDANARTFTIPANWSVAYPIGTTLSFSNMTSQVVTIAITSDTMYLAWTWTTGSRSLAQYGVATARKLTSTTWLISWIGLT